MTRKEQIEFHAGSTRDGLIANYVPTEQAIMYEDGFTDGATWADKNPKEGLVSIDNVCKWLENECDINDYLGGIFSGLCSINFDFEKLSKDLRKAMGE